MAGPLLETKLHVPRWRRGLVARPRLSERLSRGAESALTLVSAPAGFGKTTLLADWLAAVAVDGRTVTWLSLDQSDNHPASFWTYLIAALQTAEPANWCQRDCPPCSRLSRRPIETILATLLNELTRISHDFVLVLDDYHVLDSREVQGGMVFLLDHLPPRLHLVIASRADPSLPLARLRARGDLSRSAPKTCASLPTRLRRISNRQCGLDADAQRGGRAGGAHRRLDRRTPVGRTVDARARRRRRLDRRLCRGRPLHRRLPGGRGLAAPAQSCPASFPPADFDTRPVEWPIVRCRHR